MHTLKNVLILASFVALPAVPLHAHASVPTKDPYHISWTTRKGKAKCTSKGTKAKADKCAGKMRAKGKVTNVQVAPGKCAK